MSLGSLGAGIVGNVNTDKKEIQFDANFFLSPKVAPIISKAYNWEIVAIEDIEQSINYNPVQVGCSIDSNSGLLKYDQDYQGSPTTTPRTAIIMLRCKPWAYGYAMQRYLMTYSFRLYDFTRS